MHKYDAHGLPYFISSSGVMQFREVCYTVVSYAPYILLQIYTITNLATFRVTIFDFFHPGPQPISIDYQHCTRYMQIKWTFWYKILLSKTGAAFVVLSLLTKAVSTYM